MGEKFRAHAEALGTEFIEGEVTEIVPENTVYKIKLSDGETLCSKTVVYAAGASHRRLDIKGEAEFSGRGVSYCAVCDGAFYKDKTAAVIGGGDTALGDALFLSKIAKKVYLIHRRDEFRANKALQEQVLGRDNIEVVLNAVPVEITGEKSVNYLRITRNGSDELLSVNGVFAAIGTVPCSEALKSIADMTSDGYIIAGEDCVTSAKGIFAAGDVRTKALRQVITAASDGANSILSAENYLRKQGE